MPPQQRHHSLLAGNGDVDTDGVEAGESLAEAIRRHLQGQVAPVLAKGSDADITSSRKLFTPNESGTPWAARSSVSISEPPTAVFP